MKIAQALLVSDSAALLCYGLSSLLFVQSAIGEGYWSMGRLLYGVLPTILGTASAAWAIWLSFRPSEDRSQYQ
jgi:hypothetical protein